MVAYHLKMPVHDIQVGVYTRRAGSRKQLVDTAPLIPSFMWVVDANMECKCCILQQPAAWEPRSNIHPDQAEDPLQGSAMPPDKLVSSRNSWYGHKDNETIHLEDQPPVSIRLRCFAGRTGFQRPDHYPMIIKESYARRHFRVPSFTYY